MITPRENPRKIFKKFSAYSIFKKLENWSFRLGSKNRLQVQNRPKVVRVCLLVHKDQKIPLEPCRKLSHLSKKNLKNPFFKIAWSENFLRFFLGFSRSILIMMRRLSYRLSYSIVWESQKFSIIRKKLVNWFFEIIKLDFLKVMQSATI